MNKTKKIILTLASAVLLLATVGTTLAYLVTNTDTLTNIFNPSHVVNQIDEVTTNNVKSDVKVYNTGDTDAYMRAKVVVTWQDGNGNVLAVMPVAGTDYSITYNNTDWDVSDKGFYYHKTPVKAGDPTAVLITSCTQLQDAPEEGYYLSVEILSQAIQAEPFSSYTEAWNAATSN